MTAQAPIASPFGHSSTAAEVIESIDLSGKTAFISGGYSGIGTETVRALAGAGAKVIIGGRRPEVVRETLADIIDQVHVVKLELSDPGSIDACAADVAGITSRLDLLINNAAIMACPLARDARGFESQFATNHLGHFQLAARLWSLLKAAEGGARVIALSSLAHKRSAFHADDPHYNHRDYEKWAAYGQAKTANALFALHLDRLAAPHGVRAFSVHPGGIQTNLGRYLTDEDIAVMLKRAAGEAVGGAPAIVWKNPEQGASTTIWAATSLMLEGMGGVYCEDCNIAQLIAPNEELAGGVAAHACDSGAAAILWEKSEEMTGIMFSVS